MSASSDPESTPQRQIGELMTELGLITAEQLATVLEVQHRSKRPLGQIVVELGFASGAAVAHALAMQSGGALRTEYGFALGVSPELAEPKAGETGVGLPKLRLAPTAVAPTRAVADPGEAPSVEDAAAGEEIEQPEAVEPAIDEPAAIEELERIDETGELGDSPAEPEDVAAELEEETEADESEVDAAEPLEAEEETVEAEEETVEAEQETVPAEDDESTEIETAETVTAAPEESVEAPETAELHELRSEVERLQTTLAESVAVAKTEAAALAHLPEEVERLERTLAEARAAHEEELVSLRETHQHAVDELERLQTALSEEQGRYADERRGLTDQSERLQEELGATLERLATLDSAVQEGDRLRAEVERLENALGEAHGSRDEELTRLREEHQQARSELDQVRAALDDAHERHSEELGELSAHREGLQHELGSALEQLADLGPAADERDRLRSELEQLQSTLLQEQEGRAAEVAEASAQREALQEELGSALEQLADLGPAADERDRLRSELDQVRAAFAEVQESCAVEVRRLVVERDSLTAELEEAREMLQQAERVRESQIELTAERDRAVAEAKRLQALASEAQAAAEQAGRVLLEEQDGRHAERETAVAQRRMLEQELGDALERLAAANAAAGEREKELQLGSERLIEALNTVRELAADLFPGSEPPAQEAIPVEDPVPVEDAPDETGNHASTDSRDPDTEPETGAGGYSLFVPSPNGYELIPQTGVPPQAGEIVELVLPDQDEATVYEVARCSRTLPDGDVCVYLSLR
jgi:chromosome segregation ATPase